MYSAVAPAVAIRQLMSLRLREATLTELSQMEEKTAEALLTFEPPLSVELEVREKIDQINNS